MRVEKSTEIQASTITPEDLKAINAYAAGELKEEDVFTFKAILCDTQIDRDGEAFTAGTLRQLAELFRGKTVVKDHRPTADNQIARIYRTRVDTDGDVSRLIAQCYMVRTDSNADLIREIRGGIKKEGSVSCAVRKRTCSICGCDFSETVCRHVPGRVYNGATCCRILSDAQDAYEFSLVAVPAQREAGIAKAFAAQEKAEKARIRARAAALTATMNYEED